MGNNNNDNDLILVKGTLTQFVGSIEKIPSFEEIVTLVVKDRLWLSCLINIEIRTRISKAIKL